MGGLSGQLIPDRTRAREDLGGSLYRLYSFELLRHRAALMPKVVRLLHTQPEVRCAAEQPRKTKCHCGSYSDRFGEKPMNSLPRNMEALRNLRHRDSGIGQDDLTEQLPRMGGSAI
jgi:hypothetical protein